MTYTVVPTVYTNDTWTAGNHNLYIKDNLAHVEAQGEGENTVWYPIAGMTPQAGSEPGGLEVLDNGTIVHYGRPFDKDSDEFMNFSLEMPKRYDGGSVYAAFTWTTKTGAAGNVVWQAAINGVDDGDALCADPVAGLVNVTDAWQATYDRHRTAWVEAALNGSPSDDNIMLECQVGRNADHGSDNFASDAYLTGVSIRWTSNVEMDD